jgi:hypothetical protein
VAAPLAVNVVDWELQMVGLAGVTVITGKADAEMVIP